jgi:asparaginyl-tRNA synthetase
MFSASQQLREESAIFVAGELVDRPGGSPSRELLAEEVRLVGAATRTVTPKLRSSQTDVFDEALTDHLLANRHLYLRNPTLMAIMRFRHFLMGTVHQWFRERGFLEITAPILTTLPLYDDRSAIELQAGGESAYLTQCVGFYLEAAVHAFERVYNIGPSFRGEESRSKRHLMEYWHIKAEIAWSDFEDIVAIVESLMADVSSRCMEHCDDFAKMTGRPFRGVSLKTPFPRISYREAIALTQKAGHDIEFGQSLGTAEEELLSRSFDGPFWIVGIPRTIEPFPYVIDPEDPAVTRTADLILDRGYGELLGVAEKIASLDELDERLREKQKQLARYGWIRELREFGCVPHTGFGLGVERLMRWLLDIPHVRDTIPFPRIFRRRISP